MKTTKQLVHDKIVELVPELKYGYWCDVCELSKAHFNEVTVLHMLCDGVLKKVSTDLQLYHVLRAIERHLGSNSLLQMDSWDIPVGSYTVAELIKLYDLTRDHDNQSDEYYEWLKTILNI